jgi:hypothetical protein
LTYSLNITSFVVSVCYRVKVRNHKQTKGGDLMSSEKKALWCQMISLAVVTEQPSLPL